MVRQDKVAVAWNPYHHHHIVDLHPMGDVRKRRSQVSLENTTHVTLLKSQESRKMAMGVSGEPFIALSHCFSQPRAVGSDEAFPR